jgi:hypothetical protein
MKEESKPCPIYGTVYCPMCWISYGFERLIRFRHEWDDVFNEKQTNLIINLIPNEKLPEVYSIDEPESGHYSNICPHWQYFELLCGHKDEDAFDFKRCAYYKRFKELGDDGVVAFYTKLSETKNPYFDYKKEVIEEKEPQIIIQEKIVEVEKERPKISTEKSWSKFKIGMYPMRK